MIMKKTLYIISVLLVLFSCGKQSIEETAVVSDSDELVTWSFSTASVKAGITDAGAFSWTAGDQIAIWDNTTEENVTFMSKTAKGVFTATAPRSSEFVSAVYPAAWASGASSVVLPSSYTAAEAEAGQLFPMYAKVNEGTNALEFKHLGALLRFSVTGLKEGLDKIRILSPDGGICGTFTFDSSVEYPTVMPDSDRASAAVNIPIAPTAGSGYAVTIPMPVGTYNYEIHVLSGENVIYRAYTETAQTFGRAKIYKLGELPFYEGNVLLQSGVEGDPFGISQDDPYAWN